MRFEKKGKIIKNVLKSNKGITGSDIIISIIIIIIFTGLIGNLMYSSHRMTLEIQKCAQADAYTTMIFEKIDEKSYDEVNSSFIDTLKNNGELQIDNQYETTLAVTPYTNYKINNSDIFKKVTLTINYKVEQENKTYQISKLKIREIGE